VRAGVLVVAVAALMLTAGCEADAGSSATPTPTKAAAVDGRMCGAVKGVFDQYSGQFAAAPTEALAKQWGGLVEGQLAGVAAGPLHDALAALLEQLKKFNGSSAADVTKAADEVRTALRTCG
jgi:hypothetical protein